MPKPEVVNCRESSGKEGMVHISKLSKNRVEKVEDVVSLGDVVKVVCLGKDKMGRFSFSMKDVAE